ncbi:MAG: hypothetical protein GVY13_12705 [Alphaproteobacteria bacterium]|jgi:hypothetical protein|nr:hypothetical protein [Alphaproteobacteria bacterium]
MARKINFSQLKNKARQLEQKKRQAINNYNSKVREYNQKVKQAVDNYNREVRAHNQRVRANRQRLKSEIGKLARKSNTGQYATFRASVSQVQYAYDRLESAAESDRYDERYNDILDLSEREAANNAGLMNALLGDAEPESEAAWPDSADSQVTPLLRRVSDDLADRWQGALFALSPRNPDAARHFCTSAREIIAGILDTKAPDDAVSSAIPNCQRTQQGTPTRRARIKYILDLKGMGQDELESFVEADMENVVQLFHTFNKGTHGTAGKFDIPQLQSIRQRVEEAIMFLTRLIV